MNLEFISIISIIVSFCSIVLAYRSYQYSKKNIIQVEKSLAHAVLSEWVGKLNELQWESLFIERDIEDLLKEYPDHPDLIQWRNKSHGLVSISKRSLLKVGNARKNLENLISLSDICEERLGYIRAVNIASESLIELHYIKKALESFEVDISRGDIEH